jgi:hypothetical protein
VHGRRVPGGGAAVRRAEAHAHPAHAGDVVADLEIGDGLSAVRVHDGPADPALARDDELDARGGGDARLSRARPVLVQGLDLVRVAGDEPLDEEGAVRPRALRRTGSQEAGHSSSAAALRPRHDDPARDAVAGLVADGARDRGAGPEHDLDGLPLPVDRELEGIDTLVRHALLARHEHVVASGQPAELEAPVDAGRLLRRLPGAAHEGDLGDIAPAPGLEHPRAPKLDLGSRDRPVVLVLDEADHREAAGEHDGHAGFRSAADERDPSERPRLEVVVAHGQADVRARRESRGLEGPVAAGAEGRRGPQAHERAERVLAAGEDETRGPFDGTAVGVDDAPLERGRAHEGDVLVLELAGGERRPRRPRHVAAIVGAQAARPGQEPPNRVAAVAAGAAREGRGTAPRHHADARQRGHGAGLDHAPAHAGGRSEDERRPRSRLGSRSGGASLLPAVGHERARFGGNAVDEEGAVAACLHPAREGLAFEAYEGSRRRRAAIREQHRPRDRPPRSEGHRLRQGAPAGAAQLRGREGGGLDAEQVAGVRGVRELERPVRGRGRGDRRARSLFSPAGSRAQRDRGRHDGPAAAVHDLPRERGRLRHRDVPDVVAVGRVQHALEPSGRGPAPRELEAHDAGRRGQDERERAVRLRGRGGERLRLFLAESLPAGFGVGRLERKGGDGRARERLVLGEHAPPDLRGPDGGRRGEDEQGRRTKRRTERHGRAPSPG